VEETQDVCFYRHKTSLSFVKKGREARSPLKYICEAGGRRFPRKKEKKGGVRKKKSWACLPPSSHRSFGPLKSGFQTGRTGKNEGGGEEDGSQVLGGRGVRKNHSLPEA